MRARTFLAALGIAFSAAIAGMAGAAAFNPDDGFVAHVDPLWRVFGIGVYLGVIAVPVILLSGLAALVWHFAERRHERRLRT
jgi:hypothetical protein